MFYRAMGAESVGSCCQPPAWLGSEAQQLTPLQGQGPHENVSLQDLTPSLNKIRPIKENGRLTSALIDQLIYHFMG